MLDKPIVSSLQQVRVPKRMKTGLKRNSDGEGTIVESVNVTDIEEHWAESAITEAINRELVDAIIYKDGTFKPNQAITRAEFVALLVKTAKIETSEGDRVFDDIIGHWAQEHIIAATEEGIIQGHDEKTFGPDESLTREQMAVIIARTAKWQDDGTVFAIFLDADQISEWAKGAVGAAVANKAVEGYEDNTFRPKNNITRAEAVTVMLRVF